MDLPTCPACGQSVLDDEAEDCPFCGASMSGKPSARPAKPASAASPAKPAAAVKSGGASKAAAKPGGASRPAVKTAPAKPKDDDPFAVETAAASSAITLSPQPLKGRTHAITCPMCETTGYASPKAAGQEVRCANPKCLVPIFTAPEIKKEEPVVEEKRSAASTAILALSALAGLAIVGGVLWFFVFSDGARQPGPADPGFAANKGGTGGTPAVTSEVDAENQEKQPKTKVARAPSLQDLQRSALEAMINASRQGGNTTSRKPFEVRLTAEAFARAGDLKGAREQMKRFGLVRPSIPFYRVLPLVAIAWQQRAEGDEAGVQATLDEALTYAEGIPDSGRDPWESVTALATVLAATGRGEQAADLVRQYDRPEDRQPSQYWTQVYAVRENGTYDLDEYLVSHPWQNWEHPQAVAVTLGLAAHDAWEEGMSWAMGRPDRVERTDAAVAWADALAAEAASTGRADGLALLDTAAEQLSAPGQARIYARAAARLAANGNSGAAQPLVEKAKTASEPLSAPEPIALTDMKQVYNLQLPDPTEARMAAMAFGEIARAEALLGQDEAAWSSLQTALNFARGTAPSVPAVRRFLEEVEVRGSAGIQYDLQQLLNLPSADRARIAGNRYQKTLDSLNEAANRRMQLEAALLSEAAGWNLRDKVWQEISSRAEAGDPNEQENWFETAVPWVLAERMKAAGATEQAQAVASAAAGGRSAAASEQRVRQQTADLIANGQAKQAANLIQRANWSAVERNRWAMRLACRLVREKKFADAVQFVNEFQRDPLFREDAFDLIAAQATVEGQARPVWDWIQITTGLRPTERIAYLRGFVAGVQHAPRSAAGSEATASVTPPAVQP